MLAIDIKEIDPKDRRYNTEGDWTFDEDGTMRVRAYAFPQDGEHQVFLTALHEMIEAYLCKAKGITQATVDDYDMGHEEYFAENGLEPGDQEGCPYRSQHRFACLIEHMVAHELGIVGYGKVE